MKALKLWWKWRKAKRKDYPLRYIGPTIILRGVTLEKGTPLRHIKGTGKKGATGGRQFVAPDNVIRLLTQSEVEQR